MPGCSAFAAPVVLYELTPIYLQRRTLSLPTLNLGGGGHMKNPDVPEDKPLIPDELARSLPEQFWGMRSMRKRLPCNPWLA